MGASGPKSPKSLEKVSWAGSQKSEKSLGKGPRSQKKKGDFWTLFGLLGPRARETFLRLLGDFLAFGPETPSPRSTEPQP